MTELNMNDIADNVMGLFVIAMGLMFVTLIHWQKENNRQRTLKTLLENGAKLDDPRVVKLLDSKQMHQANKEEAYTGLKIGGTICLFLSVGVPVLLYMISLANDEPKLILISLGISALLVCMGAALLFCTRFVIPADEMRSSEIKNKGISRD